MTSGGGGAFTYHVPVDMVTNTSILPHLPYKNPVGALVQACRPGHRVNWMFKVGVYDAKSGTTEMVHFS